MSLWKKLVAGISSATARDVPLDSSTHAQTFINYSHHEIHGGDHFFAVDAWSGLASGTAGQIQLLLYPQNNVRWNHLFFNVSANRKFSFEFYETGTIHNTGTGELYTWNSNRNRTTGANMTIWVSGVSASWANARQLMYQIKGATGLGVAGSVGGEARIDSEIILKQGIHYWMRITPCEPDCDVNIDFKWYEHADKD